MTEQEKNAKYIFDALTEAGCTRQGAGGVLGNLEAESGIYPCRMQGDFQTGFVRSQQYAQAAMTGDLSSWAHDAIGFGLAQWTYWTRKMELLSLAKNTNTFVGDLNLQVLFLIKELKRDFPAVWRMLCSEDASLYGCSNAMLLQFERPADMSEAVQQHRYTRSNYWLNRLNELSTTSVPSAPTVAQNEAETPQSEYWPPRMICENMRGADVEALQAVLTCRGYGCTVNGIFSKGTKEKVVRFQSDNGLDADGIVGPLTWAKLLDRG